MSKAQIAGQQERLFIESIFEAESHPNRKGKAKQDQAINSFKHKLEQLPGEVNHVNDPAVDAALRENVDDVVAVANRCQKRIEAALATAIAGDKK